MTTTADAETEGTATDSISVVPAEARPRRRIPLLVWLIVLMQSFMMLGLGILYPAFQAPDEVAHIDYVIAHRHGEWLDKPGQRHIQTGVLQGFANVPPTQLRLHQGDLVPMPRGQRKSFDAMGTATTPPTTLPNQMVQHPPLYYGVAAGYTYLIPHFMSLRFDIQVFWLRFLSMLMMIPVPVLLYLTGRRLGGSVPTAVLMTLLPLFIPVYLRTGASVNNDVLLVLAGAMVSYFLARVLSGDLTRRTAALLGLCWAAMLLTKGTALVLPPVIAAAYVLGAHGRRVERVRNALVPAAIAGAVGSVVGGWWWVRNEIVLGTVQPNGYGPEWPTLRIYGRLRTGATNGEFFAKVSHQLVSRVFGSLGLIDQPSMPFGFLATFFGLMVILVAVGIGLGYPRSRSPRLAAMTLLAPTVLCLLLVLKGVHTLYWQTRLIPGVQIRYFVPFCAGLVAPAAIALMRISGRLGRWMPLAALGFVAAFQLWIVLWLTKLQFGSSGGGYVHQVWTGIHYVVGWAPWPPIVSGLFVLGAATSIVVVAIWLVRAARSGFADIDPESDALPAMA